MKQLLITVVLIGALLSSGAVFSQDKQKDDKHAQMMEMMKDSTMMKMMMEHIAADEHMHKMMLQQMMSSAKGDSAKMMGMCKMMMEDHGMHGMMKNMMGDGMKKGDMQTAGKAAPEIIVKFKPEVTKAQLQEMESESGLEKIKEIPELNMKVYRITSSKSAEEVIEAFQKHPFVVYAELNQEYRTMEMKSSNNKKNNDHQEHHPN